MEKSVSDALEELRTCLRDAEEAGKAGTWQWDPMAGSLSWSEGTARILGAQVEPGAGDLDLLLELVHLADRDLVREALTVPVRGPGGQEIEFRVQRPDGSVGWIRASRRASFGETGQCLRVSGTMRDVTEEHRAGDQLMPGSKSELLALVAGGIAHDFNNLLTVIRGRVELVGQDPALSEASRQSLAHMAEAADRAAQLTRQLAIFGPNRPLQVQLCDLNRVIVDLNKLLKRVVGQQIEVQTGLAPDLPLARADRGVLEECLLHLALAARHAMPRGGLVMMTTGAEPVKAGTGYVRVTLHYNREVTQPAEPPADRGDPVETASDLRTARALLGQLGGSLEVTAAPDGGTDFQVILPAAVNLKEAARTGLDGNVQAGSRRVLLVERDPGLRAFMMMLLARLGCQAVEADSVEAARRKWTERRGEFKLVLAEDFHFFEQEGRELIREWRKVQPELRSILITNDSRRLPDGLASEGIRCLAKPFTAEALAQAVRECLDKSSPIGTRTSQSGT